MQRKDRSESTPNLTQLSPGRYPKSNFNPKLAHGFIQGERASYDILQVIGKGGTSKVKLIEDRKSHEQHALKIIYSQQNKRCFITDEEAQEYYAKEYRILNKLNRIDPVKIQTKSKKTGVNKYQIVMDLAKGYALRNLITKKRYLLPKNAKQLLQIGLHILLDLYNTHQAGILLIDDKTENIMVDPVSLKVTRIDFGFAEDNYDFLKDKGITMPFKGTPETSAPELLRAGKVTFNQATDIYSAGIALREFLMGENFSIPRGEWDYTNIHLTQKWPSSIKKYPEIQAILLKMTSDKPEHRPSLEEVIDKFEQALKLKKGSSLAQIKKMKHDTKPLEKKLTHTQLQLACTEYKKSKDRFFGIHKLFTNASTSKTIIDLQNTHAKGQDYDEKKDESQRAFEQEQYQKAKTFISQNPHSTFAKKLAHAMQDEELIEITDAKPKWRCC